MDRRVKERLVGATILVVLIVLIVPEMLSGPKRSAALPRPAPGQVEAVRNVTVDLATNKATSATDEPGASSAASSADGASTDEPLSPAAGSPVGGSPPTISTLQAQQPTSPPPLESDASSPRPTAQTVPRNASREADGAHHNWAVQLGSFASKPNAEKLELQLRKQGFSTSVSASGSGRTLRYRVRVGPMVDRAAADRVMLKLKKEGHLASVVAP